MATLTRVSSPTLIGRGEELRELRRVLEDVLAGGSACAVVAGGQQARPTEPAPAPAGRTRRCAP